MNIMLIIKGIIVGIAKVIPGLSGAILMISFNIYDRAIKAICNFFDNVKDNTIFLLNFGIGVIVGIVCFSNVINYFINNYYLYTTSLFVGLIIGGIPSISKNMDKSCLGFFVFIISFIFMLFISFLSFNNTFVIRNNILSYLYLFLGGFVEAIGTVIPGVSSTALLMIMGVYNIYVDILSNLYNYYYFLGNINFIISFGIGLILGLFIVTYIINYFFNNYRGYTFSFIVGICIASVLSLIFKIIVCVYSMYSLIICLLLIYVGYIIGKRI